MSASPYGCDLLFLPYAASTKGKFQVHNRKFPRLTIHEQMILPYLQTLRGCLDVISHFLMLSSARLIFGSLVCRTVWHNL